MIKSINNLYKKIYIYKIKKAIKKLYKYDSDLIYRNNYEVTISCKLSQYLFRMFPKYDVDAEYNKHIDNPKILDWTEVRPDILIHKRWNDKDNLICIEIKKLTNSEARNKDYNKLINFTDINKWYWYKLWVFIDFWDQEAKIIYFSDWKQLWN